MVLLRGLGFLNEQNLTKFERRIIMIIGDACNFEFLWVADGFQRLFELENFGVVGGRSLGLLLLLFSSQHRIY